ncbi:MAG: formate dehydrogenase accessory sulfurtransferase FdhD [Acidobacteria bacterium]|nr:formate dehydrogenase accessory sulfurtransferase FdhD [Acidobacteriota bacterium]NIM60659.1 formate dehydrogenase accessory sulfurtransferase FdhD [Acidobacteriota bacterium]NIO58619.1 formate dehydrogenase accessory sulfurtransferase FdhD [Acidobacteriota bacterium]NIQ29675.1 formate dehydrogenase accessory sulfurtransferase FdhD [Acidobacteriota bacterium]NIQ84392.1 formate dehydrogenase accessory sulfurtransferase FdhD [Acidobacteriota bacterium]
MRPGCDRVAKDDLLAVEEPMEIRVAFGPSDTRTARSLSVTMRTPGNDFELAAGFLYTEGILKDRSQIEALDFCGPATPGRETSNIVRVDLAAGVELDLKSLERHFYTTSSCGICGKASLDAVQVKGIEPLQDGVPRFARDVVHELPDRLRAAQPVFDRTGGLHAAGLVTPDGDLVEIREDVGRHNAVDKLIGRRFLDGETPLGAFGMVVSGRASFEILQKALVAGIPVIVAVGAPSSLAVEMADRFGMTLIGFASGERFNLYAGANRIDG